MAAALLDVVADQVLVVVIEVVFVVAIEIVVLLQCTKLFVMNVKSLVKFLSFQLLASLYTVALVLVVKEKAEMIVVAIDSQRKALVITKPLLEPTLVLM